MKTKNIATLILGLAGLLLTSQGFAHHVADGEAPVSIMEGLLSGLAHPVIGIDHLAFLILMGAAASATPRRFLSPLVFVAGTIAGCLMVAAGTTFPGIEIAVILSVVVGGVLLLSGRRFSSSFYVGLFAVAGVFHGGAYGSSIIGAQIQPLLAYLIGFAAIQYAISVGVGQFMTRAFADLTEKSIQPRLAGAVGASIGVVLLIENFEGVLML